MSISSDSFAVSVQVFVAGFQDEPPGVRYRLLWKGFIARRCRQYR